MIRFIDLRGQHTQNKFAFFDTANNTFMSFGGDQAFNSWSDFECSFNLSLWNGLERLQRFYGLTPAWARDEASTHKHRLCTIRRKSDGMVVYSEWVYTGGTPDLIAISGLIDAGIRSEDSGMYVVTIEEGLGKGFSFDE